VQLRSISRPNRLQPRLPKRSKLPGPDLGFDLHLVPHTAKAAAAIGRKAKQKKSTLANTHDELSFGFAPGTLKES
jgi:hypothetical protein